MQTSEKPRNLTLMARTPLLLGFLVLLVLFLPKRLVINLFRGLASFSLLLAALDTDDIASLALFHLLLGFFPHVVVALDLVSEILKLINVRCDTFQILWMDSLLKRKRVN